MSFVHIPRWGGWISPRFLSLPFLKGSSGCDVRALWSLLLLALTQLPLVRAMLGKEEGERAPALTQLPLVFFSLASSAAQPEAQLAFPPTSGSRDLPS